VADHGTLFLDEVGDMSVEMQKKVLRVLQDGEFRRVGGREPIHVDVRLISASNKELATLVEQGQFRQDLFYRLNVLPVHIPPLRRRPEDIELLIDYFLKRFAAETGAPRKIVRPEVLEVMRRYPWPGNVRELENEVRRLITLGDDQIGIETVSERVRLGASLAHDDIPEGQDLTSKVEAIERREIKRALRESGRNKSRAAELLGISRFTLQRKMEKYKIEVDDSGMPSQNVD
jgi:transcriptional regulator with PAS, ATPase and Fis domain